MRMNKETMMRFRGTALLAVLVLIVLVLLLTPPSPKTPRDVPPDIPQSISYDSNALSWPGVTLRNDTGTIGGNDECTFQDSGSGPLSPAGRGHVTLIDTVSLNPGACTRTVASATYPVDSIPDTVWEEVDSSAAQSITDRAHLPIQRTILPETTTTWTGSVAVTVRDPLNLTITQTIAGLTWTGTDTSVVSWEPFYSDSWAQWSGWSRYAGRFDLSGGGEEYAYADTSAYYKNDLFCPGRTNTTYSTHWITYFQGEPGGGWQWRRSLSYSGGCSWMLHDTVTLVTP